MNKKRQSLGKSIEALLGQEAMDSLTKDQPANIYGSSSPGNAAKATEGSKQGPQTTGIVELPLEKIQPGPWQPRRHFDKEALQQLAESIASKGVLQPVLVCADKKGYALIAGERRWRACQLAGLATVPALVRESNDVDSNLMALIENVQRSDLNPLEIAIGLDNLQKKGLNHQELASAIGMARSSVTNTLRLLALPESIKQLLQHGQLEMGHARALLSLEEESQLGAANNIVARGLSVRQAEQLVRQLKTPQPATSANARHDPDIAALERRVGESIAAKVEIRHGAKGKGELRIGYSSNAQLNSLLARLAPEAMDQHHPQDEQQPRSAVVETKKPGKTPPAATSVAKSSTTQSKRKRAAKPVK